MFFIDVDAVRLVVFFTLLDGVWAGQGRRRSVDEAFFQPLAGGEEDFGLDDLETPEFTTRVWAKARFVLQ